MKPGTSATVSQELMTKLVDAMKLIQIMDLDADSRNRAELMQQELQSMALGSSGTFTISEWTINEVQSILFDFWQNATGEPSKKAIALYKEVEKLL